MSWKIKPKCSMKTTKFLIVFLSMFGLQNLKAQTQNAAPPVSENSTSGFVALNFGTSVPLSFNYAKSGYNFDISEGMPIKHSRFGIAFKFDYTGNSFDLNSWFNDNIPNPVPSGYAYAAQSSGNFSSSTVLVGAFITLPLHRFSFDFRIMGGIMFANYPSIAYAVSYTDIYGNVTTVGAGEDAANGSGVAFDLGWGVRYNVSSKICLMLNFDYLSSTPSFSTNIAAAAWDANNNLTTVTQPYSFKHTYAYSIETFGIGWVFGGK